jgi:hypothetical protein
VVDLCPRSALRARGPAYPPSCPRFMNRWGPQRLIDSKLFQVRVDNFKVFRQLVSSLGSSRSRLGQAAQAAGSGVEAKKRWDEESASEDA